MRQYRRNEKRFYRYPINRMVAVVDASSLDAIIAELGRAGIAVSEVNVLSGQEGARLLDPTGVRHGLRGFLLRLRQTGGYEADLLEAHAQALQAGGHVIYVPVKGEDERQRVIDVLRASGGRDLVHFRKWVIQEIR